MLKRKFEDKLNVWLNSNKVLLVDGARQVGKTYLVENFLMSHFKNYIYINLALNLDAISAFENAKNLKYFGSIFENVVAQELNSHGFTYNKLFYFSSKKQGEVDFLITYNGNILPIEVKSEKNIKDILL